MMKQYFFAILFGCMFALNEADWVQVWQDDFNCNGGVNTKKWDFDEGGSGWGLLFVFLLPFSTHSLSFRK